MSTVAKKAKVQKVLMVSQPTDFLVLYHSLVRDAALPPGFGEAFSGWEQTAIIAAYTKTSVPRVSQTCKGQVGTENGTSKQHRPQSSKGEPLTSSFSQRTKHRDRFEPSSSKILTKAQTQEKRQRKQNGRSGLSSWDRCWRTRPRQLLHC